MARICDLVAGLVAALAGAPLELPPAAGGVPVECDTTELELRLFRAAFGPLIPMLLTTFGLEQLETRDDLNNLALALQWLI